MKNIKNYKRKNRLAIFLALISGCLLIGCKTEINIERGANQNGRVENSAANLKSNAADSNVAANENAGEKTSTVSAPDEADDQKIIDRYIAGVDGVLDGKENKESRIIARGDIDGDGSADDAAVQFILEGMGKENAGNYYSLRLAVFRNENGQLKPVTDTEIGGLMSRSMTLKKIENGKILFDSKKYAKDDGACCPSISGATAYVLKNDKLIEVE